MTFGKFLTAIGLSVSLAAPLAAEGLLDMTNAERIAFGDEVRAYLLENPEVLIEVINELEKRQAEIAAGADKRYVAENWEALAFDGYSHVKGALDGELVVVEFLDYRCTYCKRAHEEVLALLENNDNIRFITKEYPILGEDSVVASQAAISVLTQQGDEAYEVFSDLLMRHNGAVNEKTLTKIARDAGVDADLMFKHMDDDLVQQIIAANRLLGQNMQITGTPTFVIGQEMLRGYMPLAGMQQIVDQQAATLN